MQCVGPDIEREHPSFCRIEIPVTVIGVPSQHRKCLCNTDGIGNHQCRIVQYPAAVHGHQTQFNTGFERKFTTTGNRAAQYAVVDGEHFVGKLVGSHTEREKPGRGEKRFIPADTERVPFEHGNARTEYLRLASEIVVFEPYAQPPPPFRLSILGTVEFAAEVVGKEVELFGKNDVHPVAVVSVKGKYVDLEKETGVFQPLLCVDESKRIIRHSFENSR